MDNKEELLEQLASKIADLITDFERETDVRITHLELDNRMRGTGACCAHHIDITADFK